MSFSQAKFVFTSAYAYDLELERGGSNSLGINLPAGESMIFWFSDLECKSEIIGNVVKYLAAGWVTATKDAVAITADELSAEFYTTPITSTLPAVADLAALKAVVAGSLVDKASVLCITLGTFRYATQSTATPDDTTVVKPNSVTLPAAGRWLLSNQVFVDHDHSAAGVGAKLLQANTHETPDTDVGLTSLHHTLGHNSALYKAMPGSKVRTGRITIADSATEGQVVFAAAFAGTSYSVTLGFYDVGGAATTSCKVKALTKLLTGFYVKLDAAPGTGKSVEVSYIAIYD